MNNKTMGISANIPELSDFELLNDWIMRVKIDSISTLRNGGAIIKFYKYFNNLLQNKCNTYKVFGKYNRNIVKQLNEGSDYNIHSQYVKFSDDHCEILWSIL